MFLLSSAAVVGYFITPSDYVMSGSNVPETCKDSPAQWEGSDVVFMQLVTRLWEYPDSITLGMRMNTRLIIMMYYHGTLYS